MYVLEVGMESFVCKVLLLGKCSVTLGAGNYPRHTHMLSHLPSSHKKENEKFAGYDAAAEDSPLWRADWGIKQWIPYLLGACPGLD